MKISEIKETARVNLKDKYWNCTFCSILYFIILILLSVALTAINSKLENYTVPLIIIQAAFAILSSILSYSLIANIVSILKDETKSFTKFIDNAFLNATRYIKVLLNVLIRVIIPIIIFFLCYFYFIGTYVAKANNQSFLCFDPNLLPLAIIVLIASFIVLVYFILKYTLTAFICATDNELSSKDITLKSAELMKKNKLKYILLMLSFIGWLILGAVVCFILSYFISNSNFISSVLIIFYAILRPYMIASEFSFFENLTKTINTN